MKKIKKDVHSSLSVFWSVSLRRNIGSRITIKLVFRKAAPVDPKSVSKNPLALPREALAMFLDDSAGKTHLTWV